MLRILRVENFLADAGQDFKVPVEMTQMAFVLLDGLLEIGKLVLLCAALLAEGLTLCLQTKDFLLQLGSFEQVRIAAGDGDILLEVHAVLLILTAHVEVTLAKSTGLHLTDEVTLGLQEIEIVTVKTALDSIDQHVNLVVGIHLGNLVALADTATVALLQVGGTPRKVHVMDGNATLLGIDTGTKGSRGTEQDADLTTVHLRNNLLTAFLTACILHEEYLVLRDAEVVDKTVLHLLIGRPLSLLRGGEVTENELGALLLVILVIIFADVPHGIAYLGVIALFIESRIDQLRGEAGLLAKIGDQQHLCLDLVTAEVIAEDILGIAAVGKLQKPSGDVLMSLRRRDINQDDVHLRTLQTDIGSCLVIGILIIEGCQLWNLDELPETLLHDDLTGNIELIVTGLGGKDGCPGIKAVDVLCVHRLRTKVLEKQIQLSKRVADGGAAEEGGTQVLPGTLLDGPDGIHQVPCTVAALGIAKAGDTAVTGRKRQVLESLRLIDEDMVYPHRLEVNDVIGLLGKLMVQFFKLRLQILLTRLKTGLHLATDLMTLALIDIKGFLQSLQLLLHHVTLDLSGLRDHTELVMAHDDTVIVIVLHPIEELQTVGSGIVLLTGIEDAGIGIGSLIGGGNLGDIGLHADDDGLMGNTQTLHLMSCHAHDKSLTRSNFMVANAASILKQHPNGILLGVVGALDILLGLQTLEVQIGEGLMTTVIFRTDETVELAVIHVRKLLLPLLVVTCYPLSERLADSVDLAGRKLDAVMVGTLDGVTVRLIADDLLYVRDGIVERIAHHLKTVDGVAVLGMHGILALDLLCGRIGSHDELIKVRCELDPDIRLIELAGELLKIGGRHPPLTEIEIKLLKGDRTGTDFKECLVGTGILITALHQAFLAVVALEEVYLLDDVSGKETVTYLIAADLRIEEYTAGKLLLQVILADTADLGHIVQVDAAGPVQGSKKCIKGIVDAVILTGIERDRTLKDVGLDELPVNTVLYIQHVTAKGIGNDDPDVLPVVERAETAHEIVIITVELTAQDSLLDTGVGFQGEKFLIDVPDIDILRQQCLVTVRQLHRLEDKTALRIREQANLITVQHDDP